MGGLSKVHRSAGVTSSRRFDGGTYHSSCVFRDVTRRELSERTARFSRKDPFGNVATVLSFALCFFGSMDPPRVTDKLGARLPREQRGLSTCEPGPAFRWKMAPI